jgi:hypothetical protein
VFKSIVWQVGELEHGIVFVFVAHEKKWPPAGIDPHVLRGETRVTQDAVCRSRSSR